MTEAQPPVVGEKRSLLVAYDTEVPDESKMKRARTDDGNGSDAMEVDGPILKPQEPELLRRFRVLEEREIALNKELAFLKTGQHQSIFDGVKRAEKERENKLWMTDQWRAYQLRQIEVEHDARRRQVEDEFQNDQRDLREKLIERVKEEKRRLDDEFAFNADLNDRPRRTVQRRLRSGEEANPIEYLRSSAMIDLEKHLSLTEKEVRDDLGQISRAAQQMADS